MDILNEIHKKYNNFSEKEKEIGDFILKHKEDINNISSVELATKIGTSPSTITRFSKKINCENFVDLKMKLKEIKSFSSKKTQDILFDKIYSYYVETIERNNKILNKELIYKIVSEIKTASKIYIYGVGSSGLTALELMQRLMRMGFDVHSITDSHMMIINSSIVSGKDLVIGISISGETKEIIDSLKIAKLNEAKVISITSFKESSISKFSDEILVIQNTSFIGNQKFINSQFSVMYLLDLISTILLEDSELREKMQRTIKAITG